MARVRQVKDPGVDASHCARKKRDRHEPAPNGMNPKRPQSSKDSYRCEKRSDSRQKHSDVEDCRRGSPIRPKLARDLAKEAVAGIEESRYELSAEIADRREHPCRESGLGEK